MLIDAGNALNITAEGFGSQRGFPTSPRNPRN
jgi:hypothetical protein